MYTLAHLSDPHLAPLPAAAPRMLAGKRVLGYLSWNLRRRRVHVSPVLERLTEDLKAQSADHIAVTGDITNISLPAEFEQAAAWLSRLGPAEQVSVIPGNHDAYVGLPWEVSLGKWAEFMAGERALQPANGGDDRAEERPAQGAEDFPYLRRRGPLAIVGTSSACPTPPFSAAGALGDEQLARTESLLRRLGDEGLCRVVLIHHPPLPGTASRRKQLRDSQKFRDVLARTGAELVLHGHTHLSTLAHVAGPQNVKIPVFGVAAASAGRDFKGKGLAEYALYRIERTAERRWHMDAEVRAIAPDFRQFQVKSRFSLEVPQ